MKFPVALVIVIASLGAVAELSSISQPGAAAPTRTAGLTAPILGSTVVCPDLQNVNGDEVATTLSTGTTLNASGSVSLTAIGSSHEQDRELINGGPVVRRYVSVTSGPVVLTARGPITGGMIAEQLGRGRLTSYRGYAETACSAPRTDQWFVGASTVVGADPYLQLVNTDDAPALVDVNVLTPAGVAVAPLGVGIVVGPRAVTQIHLDTLAPDSAVTAVEVRTRTGRVAAAIRDTRTHGLDLLGTDWVPMATNPSADVTVAGIPGGPLHRQLIIGNPGDQDALAQVKVSAEQDSFVPSGFDQIKVKAGSVVTLDLGKAIGNSAASVEITGGADKVPLVAGVVLDAAATFGPIHEIAFLGAVAPVTGPALILEARVATDVDSQLILSAPDSIVHVTVSVPRNGRRPAGSLRVTIPAGRTVVVALRPLSTVPTYATVTPDPGSGRFYAVRYLHENGARGPLISALAVSDGLPRVTVPMVVADLGAWNH